MEIVNIWWSDTQEKIIHTKDIDVEERDESVPDVAVALGGILRISFCSEFTARYNHTPIVVLKIAAEINSNSLDRIQTAKRTSITLPIFSSLWNVTTCLK